MNLAKIIVLGTSFAIVTTACSHSPKIGRGVASTTGADIGNTTSDRPDDRESVVRAVTQKSIRGFRTSLVALKDVAFPADSFGAFFSKGQIAGYHLIGRDAPEFSAPGCWFYYFSSPQGRALHPDDRLAFRDISDRFSGNQREMELDGPEFTQIPPQSSVIHDAAKVWHVECSNGKSTTLGELRDAVQGLMVLDEKPVNWTQSDSEPVRHVKCRTVPSPAGPNVGMAVFEQWAMDPNSAREKAIRECQRQSSRRSDSFEQEQCAANVVCGNQRLPVFGCEAKVEVADHQFSVYSSISADQELAKKIALKTCEKYHSVDECTPNLRCHIMENYDL